MLLQGRGSVQSCHMLLQGRAAVVVLVLADMLNKALQHSAFPCSVRSCRFSYASPSHTTCTCTTATHPHTHARARTSTRTVFHTSCLVFSLHCRYVTNVARTASIYTFLSVWTVVGLVKGVIPASNKSPYVCCIAQPCALCHIPLGTNRAHVLPCPYSPLLVVCSAREVQASLKLFQTVAS